MKRRKIDEIFYKCDENDIGLKNFSDIYCFLFAKYDTYWVKNPNVMLNQFKKKIVIKDIFIN